MKKYFLDESYRKFTRRVCAVLSILAGIIGLVVGIVVYNSGQYYIDIGAALGLLCVIGVWLLYWAIRWILKALPDE